MNRITAEISIEVVVRFQQRHIDTAARQQESQHHSAGPASYDATRSLSHFMRGLN
jgi:hypothetical protein